MDLGCEGEGCAVSLSLRRVSNEDRQSRENQAPSSQDALRAVRRMRDIAAERLDSGGGRAFGAALALCVPLTVVKYGRNVVLRELVVRVRNQHAGLAHGAIRPQSTRARRMARRQSRRQRRGEERRGQTQVTALYGGSIRDQDR